MSAITLSAFLPDFINKENVFNYLATAGSD